MLNHSLIEVGGPAEQFEQAHLQAADGRQERANAPTTSMTVRLTPRKARRINAAVGVAVVRLTCHG